VLNVIMHTKFGALKSFRLIMQEESKNNPSQLLSNPIHGQGKVRYRYQLKTFRISQWYPFI